MLPFDSSATTALVRALPAVWLVVSSFRVFLQSLNSRDPVLLRKRFCAWSRVLSLDPSSRLSRTAIVSLRIFASSYLRATCSPESASAIFLPLLFQVPVSSGVASRRQGQDPKTRQDQSSRRQYPMILSSMTTPDPPNKRCRRRPAQQMELRS